MSEHRYVALLRGINVGGNNIIRMTDLCGRFADMGCTQVATYIQSGNVVFSSRQKSKAKLTKTIEKALSESFGCDSRVVVVSAAELEQVVAQAPAGSGKKRLAIGTTSCSSRSRSRPLTRSNRSPRSPASIRSTPGTMPSTFGG